MSSEPSYKLVFVGGVPRAGTTMLQALLCTSRSANPFTPEFHYLGHLAEAMSRSLADFDVNHRHFSADRSSFLSRHFKMMKECIDDAWRALGRPDMLVLKHCGLTPLFGLMSRHLEAASFVTIIRDAPDVVASLFIWAAKARGGDGGVEPTPANIKPLIERYNQYYQAILAYWSTDLSGCLLPIEYEKLVMGHAFDSIADFLDVDDIEPELLWRRATFDIKTFDGGQLYSDMWGERLTSAAVGRHREVLPDSIVAMIQDATAQTSLAFRALANRDSSRQHQH